MKIRNILWCRVDKQMHLQRGQTEELSNRTGTTIAMSIPGDIALWLSPAIRRLPRATSEGLAISVISWPM